MKKLNFICFIGMLFSIPLLYGQNIQLENHWWQITNGEIHAIEVDEDNDVVYIGGNFSQVNSGINNGAEIDKSSGLPNGNFVKPNGSVLATASDGNGGWFVGGNFTQYGDSTRNRIAHLNSAGEVTAWNPNSDGWVRHIQVVGSTVYVAGDFNNIGGQPRGRVAALDINTGIPNGWNPNVNGGAGVWQLLIDNNTGYIVGQFTAVDGQARNYIAAVDMTTGVLTAWDPNADAEVLSIEKDGNTIYVGGGFLNIGGQARSRIAALDATVNTNNATAWNPGADNQIWSLKLNGTELFVGGLFLNIGGQNRNRIAELDLATGNPTAWNPNSNNGINSLLIDGSSIYVGGQFNNIGGQTRSGIAELDIATGNATAWDPNVNNIVRCIASDNSDVFIGGLFSNVGPTYNRNDLVALDMNTGAPTSWDPNSNGIVYAVKAEGDTVYVGGSYGFIGGQPRNDIAALDVTTGNAYAWNPGTNGEVRAIEKDGDILYMGGVFSNTMGQTRNHIASFDMTTGNLTSWAPNANNQVWSLMVLNNNVYVGGDYTNIAGQVRNRIASIDKNTGVATAWNPSSNSRVREIFNHDDKIYVGGQFTNIGGQTRIYIAALDSINGVATAWNPSANNAVLGIRHYSGEIYAGGYFGSIGGQGRLRLASLDANINTNNATSWNPSSNSIINELQYSEGKLYVGGAFTNISGKTRNRFAVYSLCNEPDIPAVSTSATVVCTGSSATLSVTSGNLNDAASWEWYSGTCGGTSVGSGASINVSPTTTTTYYVRGEGGCSSVDCASITIEVDAITDESVTASPTTICPNNASTISTGSSENEVTYYLRDNSNNAIIDGPTLGNGSALLFNTGNISATTTYNVLAVKDFAIDLPQGNDYVRYENPYDTYSNEITIEAWVFSPDGSFPRAGQATSELDNMGSNVWLWDGGQLYVNDAGSWVNLPFPTLSTGWTHIATVVDASGMYIYYDGVLVASNTSGITAGIMNNDASIIDIGHDPRFPAGTVNRNSNSAFDDFRVWSVARTATEIANNYNTCITGGETGLVQHSLFNEGTGTSVLSGTGANGDIINPTTNWIAGSLTCNACELEMTQTATVTVEDNAPTVATVPTNITVSNDAGICGAVVSFTDPTFDDDCDGNGLSGTLTNGLASGTQFPVGTTTVDFEYTDFSSQSVTASFDVTVTDGENPTITAPADVTVDADAGSCDATGVALGTPTTADNCNVANVTNDAPATFPLGATTVTWTIVDDAGNTATATQIVTVEDNEDPALVNMPVDINMTPNAVNCEATVTWTAPTATDNCTASPVITSSHNSGDVFPQGTTTVTYTATDNENNTVTATFDVTVASDLTASASVTSLFNGSDISCNGATDGEATAVANNGSAPYTYLWSDGQTTDVATGLAAGTYTVDVTDANGCVESASVNITEPDAITATVTETNVSCFGETDGAITLSVTGGTGAYTFLWDDMASSTAQDLSGLPAGTYNVDVTDANGCTTIATGTIVEPDTLAATSVVTDETTGNDGAIDITVVDGTAPYSYAWTGPNGFTSSDEDIDNLEAGTYEVTVTDTNGCTIIEIITVESFVGISENALQEFGVYPNPTEGQFTLSSSQGGNITILNAQGKTVYSTSIKAGKTQHNLSDLSAGVYWIQFAGAQGTQMKKLVLQ